MKLQMGYLAGAFTLLLIAGAAIAAGSKSIFDDDWAPPRASDSPRPKPIAPPKDPDPSATPQTPLTRQAIPGKAQQATVRKVLKEVFAEQLIDKSVTGRKKLTEALLAQAEKAADSPADQFVLLAAAVDAATEAASLPLAFKGADQMAALFDVDGLALKAETAAKFTAKPGSTESATENVRAGLLLVDQLSDADDFSAAGRVCTALLPLAGNSAALRVDVVKRQRELAAAREASEKMAKHFEKLKAAPEDAAANLEVGKYLCFFKNDWKSGLSALSRCGDAPLKSLAEKELAGPAELDAQVALGDAWWDLAQTLPAAGKTIVQSHAAEWYAKAAPSAKALTKAKIEKRLATVAAASAGASAATIASTSTGSPAVLKKPITNSIGMKFMPIPPGRFFMGSPPTEQNRHPTEETRHEVTISRPFNIGVTEVTQLQYVRVMNSNPSTFQTGQGTKIDTANYPVETVTWEEAAEFCKKLGELPEEKRAGRTYHFPTEAQWEYACRAGTTTAFYFGDAFDPRMANLNGKQTAPVASFPPNPWGLYDMCGNVLEWCQDEMRTYKTDAATDPLGPSNTTASAIRGGFFSDSPSQGRSASRRRNDRPYRNRPNGFRVVLEIAEKK